MVASVSDCFEMFFDGVTTLLADSNVQVIVAIPIVIGICAFTINLIRGRKGV